MSVAVDIAGGGGLIHLNDATAEEGCRPAGSLINAGLALGHVKDASGGQIANVGVCDGWWIGHVGDDLRKLWTYRDGIFADGVDAYVQFKRRQFAVVEYRVLAKGGNALWDDSGLAAED